MTLTPKSRSFGSLCSTHYFIVSVPSPSSGLVALNRSRQLILATKEAESILHYLLSIEQKTLRPK